MAFQTKTDYCGLARENVLVCSSEQMGASSSDVTGNDSWGTVDAFENVDGGATPSNSYDIKADVPFTGENVIKLGGVNTVGSDKFMLTTVNISTSASAVPTISAQAADVEAAAETDGYYAVPAFTLSKKHKAQLIFSEATIGGDGCDLVASSYAMGIQPTIDRDEQGAPNSSGCNTGVVNATLTIQQKTSTAPTVTAAEGWHISSKLTRDNQKGAYSTWTCTLTMYLERTEPTT